MRAGDSATAERDTGNLGSEALTTAATRRVPAIPRSPFEPTPPKSRDNILHRLRFIAIAQVVSKSTAVVFADTTGALMATAVLNSRLACWETEVELKIDARARELAVWGISWDLGTVGGRSFELFGR